jgi:ATP-dependent protease ClpP protease subunit
LHNLQVQCQQQAQLFQRASEIHAAAKETVALAEARFMSHQHEWNFDQAWQDMLNHATIKVSTRVERTAYGNHAIH